MGRTGSWLECNRWNGINYIIHIISMCLMPFHLIRYSHYYEPSSPQQPPLVALDLPHFVFRKKSKFLCSFFPQYYFSCKQDTCFGMFLFCTGILLFTLSIRLVWWINYNVVDPCSGFCYHSQPCTSVTVLTFSHIPTHGCDHSTVVPVVYDQTGVTRTLI